MTHPGIEEILAASEATEPDPSVAQHLIGCESCRQLAALCGAADPIEAEPAAPVPREHYSDRRELHRGGMGRATRARDRRLGREVVLKELLDSYADGVDRDALRARLEREAAITARLQHPSIVAVYEAGRWADGEAFYAMPMVRGRSLGEAIAAADGATERLALVTHVAAACDAIAYAHSEQVVHRDVKPANILIGEFGETVVIDWGLAKDLAALGGPEVTGPEIGGLTRIGAGTAAYMPPEQARGFEPGPTFDVYALGATLYHVLAGVAPYAEEPSERQRSALLAREPRPLSEVATEAPVELVAVVDKAMARAPGDRFASARELAEELRRFLNGQLTRTHRHTAGELVRRWVRTHRSLVLAIAAGVVVAAVIGVTSIRRVARERQRATQSEREALMQLERARGANARHMATDPGRTLEATELAIEAIGAALASGRRPVAEARAGLIEALAAGPLAMPLSKHTGRNLVAVSADRRTVLLLDSVGRISLWRGDLRRRAALYDTNIPEVVFGHLDPAGRYAVLFTRTEVYSIALADGSKHRLLRSPRPIRAAGILGETVFVVDLDNRLVAFDARTNRELQRITTGPVASMTPYGDHALVTELSGTVSIWNPRAKTLTRLPASGHPLVTAAAGPNDTVYAVTVDARLLRWKVGQTGPPEEIYRPQGKRARALAIAPDGARFAIEVEGNRALVGRVREPHGALMLSGKIFGRGWSPNSRYLLLALESGVVQLWDHDSMTYAARFEGHDAQPDTAAFLDNGLVVTAGRGEAYLWQATNPRGDRPTHQSEVTAIDVGRDRVLSAGGSGQLLRWSLSSPGKARLLEVPFAATAARFSPDGRYLAAASAEGDLLIADSDGGNRRAINAHPQPISAIAFTPDSAVVITAGMDGRARMWGVTDGASKGLVGDIGGAIFAVAVSDDGARLATLTRGSVRLWKLPEATLLYGIERKPGSEPWTAVSFTPDGARLFVGGPARSALYDAETGAHVADLPGGAIAGRQSPVSPSGATIALAGRDDTVILHPIAGGPSRRLTGHSRSLTSLSWSRDGATIATSSLDGSGRLWNATTGLDIATVRGPNPATYARVSDDNAHLVVGFADGAIRVVAISVKAALEEACARAQVFGLGSTAAAHCSGSTRTSRKRTRERNPG